MQEGQPSPLSRRDVLRRGVQGAAAIGAMSAGLKIEGAEAQEAKGSFEQKVRARIPQVSAEVERTYARIKSEPKERGLGLPSADVNRIEDMLLSKEERYAYERLLHGTIEEDTAGIPKGMRSIDDRCSALKIYLNSIAQDATRRGNETSKSLATELSAKVDGFLAQYQAFRNQGGEIGIRYRNALSRYFETRNANEGLDVARTIGKAIGVETDVKSVPSVPFSTVTDIAIEIAKQADVVAHWIKSEFMRYEEVILNFTGMDGKHSDGSDVKERHLFRRKK